MPMRIAPSFFAPVAIGRLEELFDILGSCCIDDEFTAKRIKVDKTGIWLLPENEHYKPIRVNPESNFIVWGIVTFVIKDAKFL